MCSDHHIKGPQSSQRRQAVERFLAAHHNELVRQGGVIRTWRRRGERVLGPYYMLTCRCPDGKQRSVYLGTAGPLVEEVHSRLSALQQARNDARVIAKARAQLSAAIDAAWAELDAELVECNLRRKGGEIRSGAPITSGSDRHD